MTKRLRVGNKARANEKINSRVQMLTEGFVPAMKVMIEAKSSREGYDKLTLG